MDSSDVIIDETSSLNPESSVPKLSLSSYPSEDNQNNEEEQLETSSELETQADEILPDEASEYGEFHDVTARDDVVENIPQLRHQSLNDEPSPYHGGILRRIPSGSLEYPEGRNVQHLHDELQKDPSLQQVLTWDEKRVAYWVGLVGFPQYRNCFLENFVFGRRLILLDASNLPKIGINDFGDVKKMSARIRHLLGTKLTPAIHSLALPHADKIGLFLEQRCPTKNIEPNITFEEYNKNFENLKFCNSLSNQALLLPSW